MGSYAASSQPADQRPDGVSPSALLTRSGKGDTTAFADLYDATAARLFGLALRIVRNPALAEEVVQETYLQVWQTAGRYEESKGSAESWMMTMTHRRAVDRIRSTQVNNRQDTSYVQNNYQVEYDITSDAASTTLEAVRAREALARLTTVQRQAIVLAYFGGYTYVEVAQIIGIPVGTTKSRIRDGLIRLRDLV